MLIKKKHITTFVLLIILVILAGCTSKQNQVDVGQEDSQNQNERIQNSQLPRWNENFKEAELSDLKIGQHILVMGAENSDGSISANQIMIGNHDDFEDMSGAMRPPMNNNSNNQNGDNQSVQLPAGFNGTGPNFERFQNMSNEERAQMREQMMEERGAAGRIKPNNMSSITRLIGEIINKDDASIILKLEDGGSKLIFLSEIINVMSFK